jgi:hypothetical protein
MNNPIIFKIGGKIKIPKIKKLFDAAKLEKVTLHGQLNFTMESFTDSLKAAAQELKPLIFEKEESNGLLPLLEECCMDNQLAFQRLCGTLKNRQPTITVYTIINEKRFQASGPQTLPIDIDTGKPLVPLDILARLSSDERDITPHMMWGLLTESEYKNKNPEVSRENKKIKGQAAMTLNRFMVNVEKFFAPIKIEM